jgi:hypothetical protein
MERKMGYHGIKWNILMWNIHILQYSFTKYVYVCIHGCVAI